EEAVGVLVADALQVGVLAEEARHRLQRPLPRPVRVGGADELDSLAERRLLARLPRLREAVARRAAEEDDLARLDLRVQDPGEVLAELAEVFGDDRQVVLARLADRV